MSDNSDKENKSNREEKKLSKVIVTIVCIALVVIVLLLIVGLNIFRHVYLKEKTLNTSVIYFEVKEGQNWRQVSDALKGKGIVNSEWVIWLQAKKQSDHLQSGVYEISPGQTLSKIEDMLASGDTKVYKVTIPEGYRIEQIAQLIETKGVGKSSDLVASARGMEGTLFPDTYFFEAGTTTDQIVQQMNKEFIEKTKVLNPSKEDLIIASIVEREAIKDSERPIIAGIYKNRMRIKMNLEADPTVQYARDNQSFLKSQNNFKFWKPITSADYKIISDFNTYHINGLPPTPICNPGIKSIEATINYEKNDFLYFIQADGNIYPSKTFEEHKQNIRKYLN